MSNQALFAGLVVDEAGRLLDVTVVGGEAQYVIDDNGFLRHIEAAVIDRQVLAIIGEQLNANKDLVEQSMMKMIGQEDIFTKAAIDQSLNNIDQILERGLPEGALQWLGMMGFRVVVDLHGEVIKLDSPGAIDNSDDE
jgi:hypothetical protein